LRGGLLGIYRVLWIALAAAAAGILLLSIIQPTAQPLIIGLRLLKAAIVMAVAAILFRRRHRDAVAAPLSLALLLWTVTSSFDFASSMTSLPAVLDRLRFLLFTVALLLFPSGEWRPRWARSIAAITVAVFALGTAEALHWLPTRSFLPLAIPCVIAATATLVVRFRTASNEGDRLQLKWVALGLVSGVGCILAARAGFALTAQMTMPVGAPLVFEALFQSGIVLIALGFLVSLLRYRLFDVETAVTRSAAYGGLTLALLATFAGSEAVIEMLGQSYFGMGIGNVAAAVAAAIAAVVLTPLHHRISHWAEQHFQHDLVTLKTQLPELLADLSEEASSRHLGEAVLPRITEAVHATRAALLIDGSVVAAHLIGLPAACAWTSAWAPTDRTGPIALDRADPVFPVRIATGGREAWLLLGPRPDGSLFGKDEIEAIATITPALRRALSAILARDAERSQARRLNRATLAKTRNLTARVKALEGLLDLRPSC
jgi:hypothetical protein